jgi:hypothetical protein
MPNRNTSHETDKLDHSTHPTSHATRDDLRIPGAGSIGARPEEKPVKMPKAKKDSNAGAKQPKDVTPARP